MSNAKWIIFRYARGRYAKREQKRFNEWFTAPVDERQKEEALAELWDRAATEPLLTGSYRDWQRVSAKTAPPRGRRLARRIASVAAAVLLPLVSATTVYIYMDHRPQQVLARCYAPNGEMRTVILPDSSSVRLNAGSVIIYPETFSGDTREIFLLGQASFDVRRDARHPFVVSTSDMTVEVLGTVFNVSAYADDQYSSVTLKSGSVKVSIPTAPQGDFVLTPGQQVVYHRENLYAEQRTVDTRDAFGWENGYLMLDGFTIHEVLRAVERKYGAKVYLASDRYDDMRVTAKFLHGETLQEFMGVLKELMPGMRYTIEEKTIYIK